MTHPVRIFFILAITFATTLVAAASARAQSTTRSVEAEPLDLSTCQADGVLPTTVQVALALRPVVRDMLRRSDDFRRQCTYLAARPRVYVRVLLSAVELPIGISARTVIQRMTAGPLMAMVTIGRRVNSAEWIAHEIEHVIEQAEGLRAKDFQNHTVGWPSGEHTFETERAIEVGRSVRDQMRRKPDTLAGNN